MNPFSETLKIVGAHPLTERIEISGGNSPFLTEGNRKMGGKFIEKISDSASSSVKESSEIIVISKV
jgi:hypothetical protein